MFEKLLEGGCIGDLHLKNRFVMAPLTTEYAEGNGTLTKRLVDFYEERAAGGVGLIIFEASSIDQIGKLFPHQVMLDSDELVPALRKFTDIVHRHDAKIAVQLCHGGRQSNPIASGMTPVAPSTLGGKGLTSTRPRELAVEEIEQIIDAFVSASVRAREAGFDAIEFHGGHGMLIAQFMSAYTNLRQDAYGGDFDRRMRFATELVRRTKEATGGLPVIFRLSGDEYWPRDGVTLSLAKEIAKRVEEAGADAIHVTAGALGATKPMTVQPMYMSRGCLVHLAEGIKQSVSIPVIAVGRINDPVLAEQILRQGKADFIAMGRALIADPELPRKTMDGRLEDIVPCIACNEGCFERVAIFKDMRCTVNPRVGYEGQYVIRPATNPKKVLVIGAGPGGMEAAIVAGKRGHHVFLYDKAAELGGQMLQAAIPPGREEIGSLTSYFKNQLRKLGVKIELGVNVTPALVDELAPDVVIAATGATPLIPPIRGIERENVRTASAVLLGEAPKGQKVVVLGGGMVGIETAEFLADKGNSVTLVEMLDKIGIDMGVATLRWYVRQRLEEKGVSVLTRTKAVEISDDGVLVEINQQTQSISADTVILATGSVADNKLVEQLRATGREVCAVGDCVRPRKIIEAIEESFAVANQL
ncbi:MAG: FAD-dependent oxidoreductase [Chloroflexota bacterium]|nr:MAG: FAD-dependent oxidoreductase [Chloroflexota bacterium]